MVKLSSLSHTWILDLDGTLLKHNGYKIDGRDSVIDNAMEFLNSIPPSDFVIIVTSRTEEYREATITYLKENNIRYDHIIFNAPYGERIIINDRKPSGLDMAKSINIDRDKFPKLDIVIDKDL